MTKRVGIFGGTFDPIHIGHLIIGQEMMLQCALDRIVFMPSGDPPLKHTMTSAEDRAMMVSLAVRDYPGFELSRFELSRPGKSYTIDTLRHLRRNMGEDTEIFLIIGADNAVEMGDWFDPEGVLDLAHVLVAERPGLSASALIPLSSLRCSLLKPLCWIFRQRRFENAYAREDRFLFMFPMLSQIILARTDYIFRG